MYCPMDVPENRDGEKKCNERRDMTCIWVEYAERVEGTATIASHGVYPGLRFSIVSQLALMFAWLVR